jgi:hypothetical protein
MALLYLLIATRGSCRARVVQAGQARAWSSAKAEPAQRCGVPEAAGNVIEKKEVHQNTTTEGRMSDSKDLKEVGDGNVVAAVRWRGGKGED